MEHKQKHFGKTLIIQPSPGIGDMIWHLPYFRALAQYMTGHKFTLLTKERGQTKDWLASDPMIEEILYFERRGLVASIPLIRERNFDTVWILHRSFSYALMAWLAGVKTIHGFGFGAQKIFLSTRIHLPESMKPAHTIENLKKILDLHDIHYKDQTYKINVNAEDRKFLSDKFKNCPKPWIAFGIGGSGAEKHWPLEKFAHLATELPKAYGGTIFLCGGPGDRSDARTIQELGTPATTACDLPLNQSIALMSLIDLYVGNDTGLMNATACLGRPALGLYATTPILDYVPTLYGIRALTMEQISPDQVLKFIKVHQLLPPHGA